MIYRYRYTIFVSSLLILLLVFIWMFTRPSTLKVAKKELNEAKSYGEVKWVWKKYEDDLSDKTDWKELIEKKILVTTLNENQKLDLEKWRPVTINIDADKLPEAVASSNKKSKPVQIKTQANPSLTKKEIATVKENNKNLAPSDLAQLYNKLGDEKCEAFKTASAPHLYHIANEYYQYAATLTKTNPKVCE